MMKNSYILILIMLIFSQKSFAMMDTIKVPLFRQYFHDQIDNNQKTCDNLDNKFNHRLDISDNEEVNTILSDMLFRKIDDLQNWIETDTFFVKNNDKIRLLKYVNSTLDKLMEAWNKKLVTAYDFPVLIEKMEVLIKSKDNNQSLVLIVKNLPYNSAKIITEVFSDNMEYTAAQKIVYFKFCKLHPELILSTISQYPKEDFTDSLIGMASLYNPSQVYSFAQSSNTVVGQLILHSKDNLTAIIAKLTATPNPLLYFPFLDDLLSGKKSMDMIQKLVGDGEVGYDSLGYYKLLVKTEIDYFGRIAAVSKDTPIAMFGANGLRETLKDKAVRHFITPINTLHNENNLSIRMRAIDSLSAEELYFMMVMGESEIYTSSFKHSFNRLMQHLGNKPRTDSLLLSVKFDYFKKFIKMTANYNRLDTFLKSMPAQNSELLMKAFVSNLAKSNNLEDATDVADSYSSINNPKLQQSILNYVDQNEQQGINENNPKAILIYNLLKNIFLSADSSNHINLTTLVGIPSIYEIDKSSLADDSGRIIEQVFFYGDEDGKLYFPQFLNSFSLKEWKITQKPEWVEIRSLKSNIWIYANLPLDYDANLDDTAQIHLNNYLSENELYPTIVVHRGHSYWLPGTISRMSSSAKIVLLGSCGGYKNLNKILTVAPDAHIISTKEIGAGDINRPIITYLNQALISNTKIVWKNLWQNLSLLFSKDKNKNVRESWENYIPPYKNLGAIFIKAYNKKV